MRKIVLLVLFFVILSSCQSNETIDLKYHVLYSVTREKGENKVSIFDSSLNLVKEKIYDADGDYSYYYFDEIDGILFLYGPGGIIKVDSDEGVYRTLFWDIEITPGSEPSAIWALSRVTIS